jgi:hypothetical protein
MHRNYGRRVGLKGMAVADGEQESSLRRNARRVLLGVLALVAGILLCAALVALALLTGLWRPYDR